MIRAHYVKHNEGTRIPRRFVFLDTEAHEVKTADERRQTFRLAVTAFDRSDTHDYSWAQTKWATHRTPAALWQTIDGYTRTKSRTVVVAHNLAYDLRIARCFDELPTLGWKLHRLSLQDRAVNAVFRRDGRSLVLVDSMAWLPMALQKIAALVAMEKLPLPDFAASDDTWERRCITDVAILRTAYLHLVKWVLSDDLGNWQRTGAGMAWSNWRHRHYTHRVLIHSEPEAQAAETESIYTGRCEAWQHGKLPKGSYYEWDLPLAYARVARDIAIPVRLAGGTNHRSLTYKPINTDKGRRLILANVYTEQPTLPVRDKEGIRWPIGQLSGWWWDVELENARQHGAEVAMRRSYTYAARPALAEWADWVINVVEGESPEYDALQRAAVKHWARALVGKFATRYTPWEPYGPAIDYDVEQHPIYDATADKLGKLLTIGGDSFVGWAPQYSSDAFPAVMATVMAECRVRLWRIMATAGFANLAYVDTDSVIVNEEGHALLNAATEDGKLWGLRHKDTYKMLKVLGPRQIIVNGKQRIAGIPRKATNVGHGKWIGETWQGLSAALAEGRYDSVVIRPADWKPKGTDRRRLHLPGGATAPVPMTATEPLKATG